MLHVLHAGTCTRVVDEYNLKGDYPHHFQVEVRSTVFTLTAGSSILLRKDHMSPEPSDASLST